MKDKQIYVDLVYSIFNICIILKKAWWWWGEGGAIVGKIVPEGSD